MTQKKKFPPQTGTNHFSDLGIEKRILDILAQRKFKTPTPIQHQVIPSALRKKDSVGIAQTGTGKTLAFGIPMIERILRDKGQGLILVPTRELAVQVEQSLRNIGTPLGLRSVVVIGGLSKNPQIKMLRRNPHIVIATPGRLADLIKQKAYTLNKVNIIVLDEADRMLDIGFLPEIRRILQAAPKERQTMLFSATMPQSISLLASEFMKLPLRIEIAPQGTSADNIEQEIFVVQKSDKMRLLDSILQQSKNDKILVFSRTKYGAKRIARDIRNMGYTATEIHSNRSQAQRQIALDGFKKGRFRIMVATDIAARGIDVKDIALVINFDLPDDLESYVHRIGRTGRAGNYGKAISFVTPPEKANIRKIERLIRQSLPISTLPALPPKRERPQHNEGSRTQSHKRFNERNHGRNSYQGKRPQRSHNNYSRRK